MMGNGCNSHTGVMDYPSPPGISHSILEFPGLSAPCPLDKNITAVLPDLDCNNPMRGY
jgi:hypothetical protein